MQSVLIPSGVAYSMRAVQTQTVHPAKLSGELHAHRHVLLTSCLHSVQEWNSRHSLSAKSIPCEGMTYCLANASRGVSSAAWDSEASVEKVSNLCLFVGLAQLQQKCKNVSSARTFHSSDFKHRRTIAKQKVYAVFISLTEYKLDVEFPFGRKD